MRKTFLVTLVVVNVAAQSYTQGFSTELPASTLINWMKFHSRLVRDTRGIQHVAYSRHFAYTAIAAYESVVGSNPAFNSLAGQLNGYTWKAPAWKAGVNWQLSLNAAYAAMLRHFYDGFPSCSPKIDSMERALSANLTTVGAGEADTASISYGKAIAAAVISWSLSDSSSANREYTPLSGDSVWKPEAPAAAPFWSKNRSMTRGLLTAYQLQPPRYSTDTASAFYNMVKEVYVTTQNLTEQQKATAHYWDDSPNGRYMTVFGHWASIAAQLMERNRLHLVGAAEAFARMAVSMHEASLLAWKGKYQHHVVRPVSFIRRHMDPRWESLIFTPNHPEFPAAHATLSNAAAVALCSVFGEHCQVSDSSYTDIGLGHRKFGSLQEMAREAGLSRLYGGIHYRYSIDQGFALGAAAARHVDGKLKFRN